MKTKVITNEDFNGKPMFKIYEVDDEGNKAVEFDRKTGEKKDKKALISFGVTKAKLIDLHELELAEFLEGVK